MVVLLWADCIARTDHWGSFFAISGRGDCFSTVAAHAFLFVDCLQPEYPITLQFRDVDPAFSLPWADRHRYQCSDPGWCSLLAAGAGVAGLCC